MASSVRVTTRRVHYQLDKVQGQRFCFQLEWSKESNSSWRSTGEVCRRTCSAWPWDQQEGKKKFQDRMQLVSKCNCYTHLLHKCCKSQSVQLCSPKFSEQIRKKAKKKKKIHADDPILKHCCAPCLFYWAEIRWLWGCLEHNVLGVVLQETVWDGPGLVIGRVILLEGADGCAVAINRWIWSVIILGQEYLNSVQLLLPLPLQTHDTFMFYVVYTELWPFTCRRINHTSTDETLPVS